MILLVPIFSECIIILENIKIAAGNNAKIPQEVKEERIPVKYAITIAILQQNANIASVYIQKVSYTIKSFLPNEFSSLLQSRNLFVFPTFSALNFFSILKFCVCSLSFQVFINLSSRGYRFTSILLQMDDLSLKGDTPRPALPLKLTESFRNIVCPKIAT